jgi:transcriptional regulator with XRE-family HTH domain
MSMATKFPSPLRLAIAASGRTQRDIAEAAGISERKLSQIVNGLHADEATQELIASELRQSRADLFPAYGEAA